MKAIPTLPSGCFNGNSSVTRSTAGIKVTEISYSPGTEISAHAHELPYFCLVLKGSYSEKFGGHVRESEALDVLFHPSGEVQSQSFHQAGGRCLAIELGAEFMGRVAEYLPLLESRGGFVRGYPASLALAVYEEFRNQDEISLLAIEAAVLQLTVAAVRYCGSLDSRRAPPWLTTVEELLRQRFTERLTLHDISSVVGVHPVLVARSFRKFRGISIADFLRRQRIEFAWRQLAKRSVPLSQIALDAGFCDQSHFSRVFKRLTGIRPSQFHSRTQGAPPKAVPSGAAFQPD